MTSRDAGAAPEPSPLDALLDIHRVRQYFDTIVRVRELGGALRRDAGFVDALRRTVLPLPTDRRPPPTDPFPTDPADPPAAVSVPPGRLAIVSSGGSGATACLVGVAQVLEEAGRRPDVYSVCSGSALFGFPLAAGLTAREAADLALGLRPRECVDVAWRSVLTAPLSLGRGFIGLLHGDRIEAYFRHHLGDRRLGDLPIPVYAPVWSVQRNRLEYLGPRTHADVPVARAIRMAISMPLFFRPVKMDGQHWCDGGIVDILPVHPVLDLEPPCATAIVLNVFYPPGFAGEDATGWEAERASILRAASQIRTSQHITLARENLARLRARCDAVLLEPVPYTAVRGTGFYRQFIDTADWPQFIAAGAALARQALRAPAPDAPAPGPAPDVLAPRPAGNGARSARTGPSRNGGRRRPTAPTGDLR